MRSFGVFVALQLLRAYSASIILAHNDISHLTNAAAKIVDTCFGSYVSDRWSELLIIPDQSFDGLLKKIHHQSKTSNSILFLDQKCNNGLGNFSTPLDYATAIFKWQETKTTAVIVTTHSLMHLECVLYSLKNDIQRLWRPRSYLVFIADTGCDVNMFNIIWKYWILNAIVLCSSNKSDDLNGGEIELYTYNPYSSDHSQQWEIVINETVQVSLSTGNFNHSWYIFKRIYTEIRSLKDCGDLYFDKTSNLDGYIIPIAVGLPGLYDDVMPSPEKKFFASDIKMLKTLASKLRFNYAKVFNDDKDVYGRQLPNGTYFGSISDVYEGRAHLAPSRRPSKPSPGLEIIYPFDKITGCFSSRIVGNYPPWTNLAVAGQIWIGLGLSLSFAALIFYLQSTSQGIVAAILDALRLLVGSSVIRTSPIVKHRVILGSIFLVFLVLDGAIKGRFISIITIARPYPNLDTIAQLDEQDVDMYGYFAGRDATEDPRRKARFNFSVSYEECVESLEQGGQQAACFVNCPYVSYSKVNLSIIHKTLTPILSLPAGSLATMHWPMTDRYSFEIQKLFEAGMYAKWESNLVWQSEMENWNENRMMDPPSLKPTKLSDLLPAFLLLFIGLSTSLIVFTWEKKLQQIILVLSCIS